MLEFRGLEPCRVDIATAKKSPSRHAEEAYPDSFATLCGSSAAAARAMDRAARGCHKRGRVRGRSQAGQGMGILSEIFSWWGGNTWSNRIYTALRGKLVGTDAAGNRYYIQSKGIGPLGVPRRWVIYSNGAEASQVSPDWHGWMHYTVDTPPTEQNYQPRPWQKPHLMNMTGTAQAYRPRGSILATGKRPKATGDYKPWRPT
jgi:NADH:ubiquinone oxidoreductase subunit